MKIFLLCFLLGLHSSALAATQTLSPPAAPTFGEISTSDNSFFAHQESKIIFQIKPSNPEGFYGVVQVDEQGNILRYLGSLLDNGIVGDQTPHDGIFARKLEFKQKKEGTLYFHVISENQERNEIFERSPLIKLEVLRRPSFVEVAKDALSHIFH